MQKLSNILKTIILIIGIVVVATIVILNLFLTSRITSEAAEIVKITFNGLIYILGSITFAVILYYISKYMKKFIKISKFKKILIFIGILIIYFTLQVVWINYRNAYPGADQNYVYSAAVDMYENEGTNIDFWDYFAKYPQQLSLMFDEILVFKIFNTTNVHLLQYINAFTNCFTVLAIYLITGELSKKVNVNKYRSLVTIFSFVTLPLLSTFVYGDLVGLTFSLFSVLFIMKYENHQDKYDKILCLILSTLFMAVAYMTRMNMIIVAMAIVIYMCLNLLKENENAKLKIARIISIVFFIVLTIMPGKLIINHYSKMFNLSKDNKVTLNSYLAMAFSKGQRSYGWYTDKYFDYVDEYKNENISCFPNAEEIYTDIVKYKVNVFLHNPKEFVKFFTLKNASMWAENSYAERFYNSSYCFGGSYYREDVDYKTIDDKLEKSEKIIMIEQKGMIILLFTYTLLLLIIRRKEISNEELLLLITFLGGFFFHNLWEAKSRYIIPYIIALIPLISVEIDFNKLKLGNKNKKIKKLDK